VTDPSTLLAAYDAQLRADVPDPLPAGVTVERDGPLLRFVGLDGGGFLTYIDLDGLSGDELDALIARQRDYFAGRGERVEWKLHGHDQPADLPQRLRAAGFEPEDQETVVVGPVAPLAATMPVLPEGVRLREVSARADLERIVRMEEAVWGDSRGWLADSLEKEIAADPQALTVLVAEVVPADAPQGPPGAAEELVSAGWVRYMAGTGFGTLWGGSTLPQWRGRGLYKALVVHRARLAAQRGYTYLQVDASDDSRPILERLGFVPITTTTPYVFEPQPQR
jgi:ribosomal protein S18 acetylase RimI-like enzyme